jgi:hypothetical protein
MQTTTNSSDATHRNINKSIAYAVLFAKSLVPSLGAAIIAQPAGASTFDNIACVADLNGDDTVDGSDLAELLGAWNTTNSPADLSGDGIVDAQDLALLLGAWGQPCRSADFDADGVVDGRDLAEFARRMQAGDPRADLDRNGMIDAADLEEIRADAGLIAGDRQIDHRPVVMLRAWNGSFSADDELGLSPRYTGAEGPAHIAEDLQSLYDEGWRRIWMLLPAGCRQQDAMKSSVEEFRHRDRAWQRDMQKIVGAWIEQHPDATIGIYTGPYLRGGVKPDEQALRYNLMPWIRLGVTEFVFDATSAIESRDTFANAVLLLEDYGARAVMEAIPTYDDHQPIDAILDHFPAMGLKRFVDMRDPEGRWAFHPDRHEVFVEVGRGREVTASEIYEQMARGFTPGAYAFDPAQRIEAIEAAQWFRGAPSIEVQQ